MFSKGMKDSYLHDGFLVVRSLFGSDELQAVRARMEEIIADPSRAPAGVSIGREGDTEADTSRAEARNQSIRGIAFLARFDPTYRAFAQHPKLLDIVRGLLGPRVKLFRDQALLKPPGGQAKPVHQDQSYFRVVPMDSLVTAWIALDEATEANGCMVYVPGSHRHGIFDVAPDPRRPVHHVPQTGHLRLPPAVACPVPPGSVILHHGCTLHASGDNNTETWRRAVIFHYTSSEARSEKDELNRQVSLEIDP